ncbi:MAG: LLM class flavin-dependent oxidoreductase [Armatimonadetes bacterium]|nr:LLM class flavin-dependent oxidoreductase [Armatimonadota bacterium]
MTSLTFGLGVMPWHPPDRFVRIAQMAEALGFTTLWVPDERFFYDCYSYMTLAARATTRLRMGPCVTDPYSRHPALTAAAMYTLHELSGGRMVLGIGAGASGFDAMGIDRPRPAVAIREAVELIRKLGTGDDATCHGELIQFHGGTLHFRPTGLFPVYVAGRGPKILELAGRIGDGVIIGALASPETLGYAMKAVRAGAARAGRSMDDLDRMIWLHTAVHADGGAAKDAVRKIVAGVLVSSKPVLNDLGVRLSPEMSEALAQSTYGMHSASMARVTELVDDDLLRHFTMAGDPEYCRAKARDLAAGGITHLAALPWLAPGQSIEEFIETFAREVIAKV